MNAKLFTNEQKKMKRNVKSVKNEGRKNDNQQKLQEMFNYNKRIGCCSFDHIPFPL